MERVRLGRASGCSNTPSWSRNDVLDLQRAMSMKVSVENEKSCNQTTMGERLERLGETWIVAETDYFRLDFIEKMERRFRNTNPDRGAVLKRKSNLRHVYS